MDLLPCSLEAEKAVLGSALIETPACRWAIQYLVPEAFYQERNRLVFESLRRVFQAQDSADMVLVGEDLRRAGKIGDIGGSSYLAECQSTVATAAHVEHYGKLVLRAYYDRQVIREAERLKSEDDREDALDKIGRIFRARDLLDSRGVVGLKDSIGRVLDQLGSGPVEMTGTGFSGLDEVLGGSEAGDLLTVGARTGVGKTAFLVCMALNLAKSGKRVAFFAGEMGPDQVTKRALAAKSQVEHWRIRTRRLDLEAARKVQKAAEELVPLEVFYCGLPSPRLQDIKATCDACRADIAVVDYLTRCTLPQAESMRIGVNRFMVGLKNFARETNRIVYLAAQVNRLTDKSPDSPPTLSDLKESGAIEEESDAVLLMHMDREYRHQDGPVPLKLAVAKNRHGRTGACEVTFDRRYMEVSDGNSAGAGQDEPVGIERSISQEEV